MSRARCRPAACSLGRARDRSRAPAPCALIDPLGQLRASLRRRAQRRQPTGQQAARRPLGLEQRAQRQQVVAQRLVARSSRSQPSSKRRSAQASSLPCGARRETRLQNARSSSSCSALTTSIPCGRPPAPSASGFHGPPAPDTRPGERAERDPAVAEQPQRAQQVLQHLAPARERIAQRRLLGCEHHEQVLALARRRAAPEGSPQRFGWAIVRPLVSASSVEVIVSPCSVATSVTSLVLAQRRLLEPRQSASTRSWCRRSGRQLEVGLLLEHILQQQPQRRARARVGLRPPRSSAAPIPTR